MSHKGFILVHDTQHCCKMEITHFQQYLLLLICHNVFHKIACWCSFYFQTYTRDQVLKAVMAGTSDDCADGEDLHATSVSSKSRKIVNTYVIEGDLMLLSDELYLAIHHVICSVFAEIFTRRFSISW